MAEDKVKSLYDTFVNEGYEMESESDFRKNLAEPSKRKAAYEALKGDGYEMEPFEEFEKNIGFGRSVVDTVQEIGKLLMDTAQVNKRDATISQPNGENVSSVETSAAKEQEPLRPTEQDKIRTSYEINQIMQDYNKRSRERVAEMRRVAERSTPEGRARIEAIRQEAMAMGLPTNVMGISPGMVHDNIWEVPNDSVTTQQETAANGNIVSPVPYGVTADKDGKAQVKWLMPDGSLTTNLTKVDAAEYTARQNRIGHEFEQKMRKNGLDPSDKEDVQRQIELDEAAVQERRGRQAYERRLRSLDTEIADAEAEEKRLRKEWEDAEGPNLIDAFVHGDTPENLAKHNAKKAAAEAWHTQERYVKQLKEARERWNRGMTSGDLSMVESTWKGIKDGISEIVSNPFGFRSGADAMLLRTIQDKANSGKDLTEQERRVMESYMFKNQTEQYAGKDGAAYQIAKFIPEMSQMALEFAGAPGAGITRKATEMGLKKIFTSPRLFGKALGSAVAEGASIASTTQLGKNMSEAEGRELGAPIYDYRGNYVGNFGDGIGVAMLKTGFRAVGSNAIFLPTTQLGQGVMRYLDKSVLGKGVADIFRNAGEILPVGNPIDGLVKMKTSELLSVGLGDETFGQWADPENNAILLGSLFASEFAMGLPGKIGQGYRYYNLGRARANVKQQYNEAARVFSQRSGGEDLLKGIAEMIMSGNDEAANNIISMLGSRLRPEKEQKRLSGEGAVDFGEVDERLSREEWVALTDLTRSVYRYMGVEQAYNMHYHPERLSRSTDKEVVQNGTPDDIMAWEEEKLQLSATDQAENSYADGIDASARYDEARAHGDEQALAKAQAELDAIGDRVRKAREAVEDAFGDKADYYMWHLDEDPWVLLEESPDVSEHQQDAVLEYINAKAALDGVLDGVNETKERKREQVESEVKKRTHRDDGTIQPATLRDGDRPVYIVKGGVVTLPDGGVIDVNKSSRSIIVMDQETGECKFVAPNLIASVGERIDPKQELQAAFEQIEAEGEITFNAPKDEAAERTGKPGESVTETGIPAPEAQRETSPLERIPRDAKGEPLYEQVDADLAWDGLLEKAKDEQIAQNVIAQEISEREEALRKLEKKKPKAGLSTSEKIAAEQDKKKAMDDIQKSIDHWKEIATTKQRREAEERRQQEEEARRLDEERRVQQAAEEAAARREAAERAEAEAKWKKQKAAMDKRVRDAAEEMRDCREAIEIINDMAPQTIDEVAALVLSNHRVLLSDDGVKRGVKRMVGLGRSESKKLIGQFAKAENGGISLERLAEDIMQEECAQYGVPYENDVALNALMDLILSARTRGDITGYIAERRLEQARRVYDEQAQMEDNYFLERYGMTKSEFLEEEETRQTEAEKALKNFDETEYYNTFAHKILAHYESSERGDALHNTDIYGLESNSGVKPEGEIASDDRGGEVLSGARSILAAGKSADGERSSVPSRDGQEGVNPQGNVGETSRTKPSEREIATAEDSRGNGTTGNLQPIEKRSEGEVDEHGVPFVKTEDGSTVFGEITEDCGLPAAPIKLSIGSQDNTTKKGYGLIHIEVNHGKQIRDAGFKSVEDFVSYVAKNYDPDNIRVGKRREDGNGTFLIQVVDSYENTLYIELSKDGSYWGVNSGGVFRKGYANKKETVAKTEPQQPNNAVSSDSSLSTDEQGGKSSIEPNGEPTVSERKVSNSASDKQEKGRESSVQTADSKGAQSVQASVEAASAQVNTSPTRAQAAAGNYKKGHVTIGGFDITIENPAGSVRRGVDADGKEWETTMANAYGEIKGTESTDGDPLDVFLNNYMDEWNGCKVYVVDQTNTDGTFDEHKVMLGFNDKDEAMGAYLSNYDATWAQTHPGLQITETSIEDFNKWIKSSHRKTKAFAEYKSIESNHFDNQGNPIDENGNLIIEEVKSIDDISDEDYINPTRTVGLPKLPDIVSDAIGANGKRVIIKKNIFGKNYKNHKELSPAESREILRTALYTPTLYGQNQKQTRPYNWILIHLADKNTCVLLEVDNTKENCEIVNWHYLREETLKQKERQAEREGGRILTLSENKAAGNTSQGLSTKRQAEREDGQLLILSPVEGSAAALSALPSDVSSDGKDSTLPSDKQTIGAESSDSNNQPGQDTPLSREDFKAKENKAMRRRKAARKQEDKKGEAESGDQIAGTTPKPDAAGRFEVTEEMKSQEDELRRLLGINDSEGDRGDMVREPESSELPRGVMRKVYAAGVDYAFNYFDNGVTGFDDFAKAIVGRLGERVKPFVKSWYEGAKRVPGYGGEGYTPTEEVERYNLEQMHGEAYDPLRDAMQRTREYEAAKAAREAEQELKEMRDEQAMLDNAELSESDRIVDEFSEKLNSYFESLEGLSEEEATLTESALEDEIKRCRDELSEQLRADGVESFEADRISRETITRAMSDVASARRMADARRERFKAIEAGMQRKGEAYGPVEKSVEGAKTYTTETGDSVEFLCYGEERKLAPGEVSYVERKFTQSGDYDFTGSDRVESADDVAYIFRQLESFSTEHSFAVIVKDGKSHIIHIGMGNEVGTVVSSTAIRAASDALGGADKIYFVHNHPSGLMRPSPQDIAVIKHLQEMLPNVVENGIIIDTLSGQYSVFGGNGEVETKPRPQSGGERPLPVYRFNHTAFKAGYDFERRVNTPEAAAEIISSLRLGQRDKRCMLVLNNGHVVVGSFVLGSTTDSSKLAEEAVQIATRFGGKKVIFFGNHPIEESKWIKVQSEVTRLSGGDMTALGNITVTNGLNSETDLMEKKEAVEQKTQTEAEIPPAQEQKTPEDKPAAKAGHIEDFGEVLEGARKDVLKNIAQQMEDVTVESLVKLPLSQVFKRPDTKKAMESGALSAEEAMVVEAMSIAVLSNKKPATGRSSASKRPNSYAARREANTLANWAEGQKAAIQRIQDYLNADSEGRKAIVSELENGTTDAGAVVKADALGVDNKELNPAAVMYHILQGCGFTPGQKVSPIGVDIYKRGTYWYQRTGKDKSVRLGTSAEGCLAVLKAAFMLKNGIEGAQLPPELFSVRVTKYEMTPSGEYRVSVFKGSKIEDHTFGSQKEAEAFKQKAESNGKVSVIHEIKKAGAALETELRVVDPIKHEYVVIEGKYTTPEEARAALDADFESINAKACEAIMANNQIKRQKKQMFDIRHFPKTTTQPEEWGVVMADGKGYGEIISSHTSESAAKAAAAKLEEQYNAAIEQRRNHTYFVPVTERIGKDYRDGKDATAEMYNEAFGFRGVQFGNWTNQRDRQSAMNQAYDGLMDLAKVLGVPTRALSLGGELGIAFGARGGGSALAHYEPDTVVINLTKTKGEGSLAHEWWHALDNYFARRGGMRGWFATETDISGMRDETAGAFKALREAVRASHYQSRSSERGAYWGSMRELTARLFAQWVDQRLGADGEVSPFLSRGVDPEQLEKYKELNWTLYNMRAGRKKRYGGEVKRMSREEFMKSPKALEGYVFVTAEELEKFDPLMDTLFKGLEFRENEGRTEIYEPEGEYNGGIGLEYTGLESGDGSRSLSEEEATDLVARMEAEADVVPSIELTPDNWIAQFGEDGKVATPLGVVKMGENQYSKLVARKRAEYFGMIKPTLTAPDVILEETDPKDGAERDSKYLFIKTFKKQDGSRIVYFESVTVRKDGMEVAISNHEIKGSAIKSKMQNDKILHLDKKLSLSSEWRLTETPNESEGPDLVPTSDNVISEGKGNTSPSDMQETDGESFGGATEEGVKYSIRTKAAPNSEMEERMNTDPETMAGKVRELASELGLPVRVIVDRDEANALPVQRMRDALGFYDGSEERAGRPGVTIVIPNNRNMAEAIGTLFHEGVWHKGIRLFCKTQEALNNLLDHLYDNSSKQIQEEIGEMEKRFVQEDVERLSQDKEFLDSHRREGEGEIAPGSPLAVAIAHAEVWERQKRGDYRREATEEYGAQVQNEIKEGEYAEIREDKLRFFERVMRFVEKSIEKILRGLKLKSPKKYGIKEWKMWGSLFERRLREDGKMKPKTDGIFSEAEKVVARYNDERRAAKEKTEPTWAEKLKTLTDTKKSSEGKTIAPEDWPSHAEAPGYVPSLPKISDAKVATISENLKLLGDKIGEKGLGKNEILYELIKSLGIKGDSRRSNYIALDIMGCGKTTLRISNHSAKTSNFGATDNNVGIVIKTSNNRFRPEASVDYVEFMYFGDKVEGNGELQRGIVEGLRHYIETGSFEKMPEADRLNTSGAYGQALRSLNDIVRYRVPGMGLEETITKMKIDAMQANATIEKRLDMMSAIGENLSRLRQAMSWQREYDITTVKSVSDLARVLMDTGLLDDMSKYEMKRILGAIDNVVGKQDVSTYVQKVMDIMVDNQLRMGANAFGKLLSIRGSRVDARGIEVQGELDPDGQKIVQVVRKSTTLPKADIDNRIAEAVNRMSSNDQTIADEATIEYTGLQIARQYVEDITESKAEEKELRDSIKQAKEDKDAGQMTKAAYKQYVEATEEAIRQNKVERAEAFYSLAEQLGGMLGESAERAKAWREAEKKRVEEVHHNANSDMKGRPTDEHHKDSRVQKIVNNNALRFVLAPLATFDQMLRMFGSKNVRGEGYLWNRYMRGWVEATETEYTNYHNALKKLDKKVSEVFGKKMTWGGLFGIDRKLPKASVKFWDGGEMKAHELTQGNLLYIYMADKMSDGRMKLRKMGITEEDIENIKNFLDPRFIELADWMQEEFLVGKRNEYNEVHKRMFGASMAAIENYFPLKILANARLENVDVADDSTDTVLPATSTGSIIKRRRNNLALDVTGANAFSIILDHLQQMERWAAFAEFNRDLNTLLSYKRFRNQVMNMSSAYGAGKTLWNNFRNVCSMAAGSYRPPIAALDKAAVNIAKGATVAKVNLRVFTALKQLLSMPAYVADCNPIYLAANIANPIEAWKWSMKNLPLFEKRWSSRMAGDPRLLKTEMDWKMWRNRVVEVAARVGMSPNAFVDAVTVAIGSHSMYQTKLAKYKRMGYDAEVAEKRAKQDATILFNQTQQSSEGAFLSTMQVDRSWLSVLFTVFRNSSMSYTRQLYDSMRNLGHRLVPGYKGMTEEYMAKQMIRDGIDPDKATENAKREYRRGIIRDIIRVGVFGYILQFAWNMGAYLPYLILGDNEDEKDKMMDDVLTHTMFGSIEGLTGGDVMSAAGNMLMSGEGNPAYLSKDMPLASDVLSILKKMDKDYVSSMNDVINLCVQCGLGVNPQTLTDATVAVMDYCGEDAQTSRECALLITRILNCPQSQIDKLYFDEIEATGEEASKMGPAEIAERYAEYKTLREAPLTGWLYDDEARAKVMDKHRKRAKSVIKERANGFYETDITRELLAEYEEVATQERELNSLRETDKGAYREGMRSLRENVNMRRHNRVKRYNHKIKQLTEKWLNAKSANEANEIARAMIEARSEMLEDIDVLDKQ